MRPYQYVTEPRKRTRSVPVTTPAPYMGLNTVDSLGDMDPRYGLSIQNFIASPQGLKVREGYLEWATGMPADVTAIIPYNAAVAASSKLFAISGTSIYDVTSAGPVGAAVITGLSDTNIAWTYASQSSSTAGKNFLICVNGFNAPRMYDGTSWTTCTQVVTPSAVGEFANLDNNGNAVSISNFSEVILHQQRMWFVSKNTTRAYYTNIAQPSGALFAFDFGPLFPRGGTLLTLDTWSVNTGSVAGVSSKLVAISSKGDIVIFEGDNPATAATWSLAAVYQLAAPAGMKCTLQYSSDLLYLSRDGLYPLSKYIQSSTVQNTSAFTTKIAETISDLIDTFGDKFGFEMALYPGRNLLLLNVPQTNTAANFQFCYNTITNGWSQFTGWAASTWGLYNNGLYFGTTGKVCLAFVGNKDGADQYGAGGSLIQANALTAFDYMEKPGLGRGILKQVHQVKPYIVTGSSAPVISIGVNTDGNLTPIVGSTTLSPPTGAVWDTALWDNPNATWAGALLTFNQWSTPVCYPGDAIALAISISADADVLWTSTGWIVEPGGQWG